jgi:CO/xanthine dehydrogenase FAD-binding subunit
MIDIEKELINKELSSETIKLAIDKAINNLETLNDFRTTKEHQKEVVKTLIKRALEDCQK